MRVPVGAVLLGVAVLAGCSSRSTGDIVSSASSPEPTSSSAVVSRSPSPAEVAAESQVESAIAATRNQAFLGILQISSLTAGPLRFADDATLIATAEQICRDLGAGRPAATVVDGVAGHYGGDTARGRFFTRQAIDSFCPERSASVPR